MGGPFMKENVTCKRLLEQACAGGMTQFNNEDFSLHCNL